MGQRHIIVAGFIDIERARRVKALEFVKISCIT